METLQLAQLVVEAAKSKHAQDTVVLDMAKVSLLADYFILTSGNNERQLNAIVTAIEEVYGKTGRRVKKVEGRESGKWILLDLGDIVVHVFHPEERSFYNLEKLWKDAPMLDISEWSEEK